jgi:shikimate dehydrogenase
MTQLYGIIGHPIGHSLSPAMHNAAFKKLGLDALYVPFAVPPERLDAAISAIKPLGLCGLNVTLPHKSAVMKLLDRIEPDAQAIGAVNTIVREGEALVGSNTDAPGLQRALREASLPLTAAKVTVLGAGGAARAAVVGLARAGVAEIYVAARRESAAAQLVSQLKATVADVRLESCSFAIDALQRRFAATDLLVQATSATLGSGDAANQFTAHLPLDALSARSAVVDLVYDPLETSLLVAAKRRGLHCVDGLGMLLHQGAIAFERWTGRTAPIEAMRAALLPQKP